MKTKRIDGKYLGFALARLCETSWERAYSRLPPVANTLAPTVQTKRSMVPGIGLNANEPGPRSPRLRNCLRHGALFGSREYVSHQATPMGPAPARPRPRFSQRHARRSHHHRISRGQHEDQRRQRRRVLGLDRGVQSGRHAGQPRRLVSHRQRSAQNEMAISRRDAACRRLPDRLGLERKSPRSCEAPAHQFRPERRGRLPRPHQTGRHHRHHRVCPRVSPAIGRRVLRRDPAHRLRRGIDAELFPHSDAHCA